MYTCPTDDIHSIYLDNELPENFKAEYEAHLTSCEACRNKLEKLRGLKNLFQKDSTSIKLDEMFMKQSYERLQTKLRYSKNTRKILFKDKPEFKLNEKYISAGIGAAAAIVVSLVIPLRFSSSKQALSSAQLASINPIERPVSSSSPISNGNIVINGNINDNLAHNVSTGSVNDPRFADVDVFRPEFKNGIIYIYANPFDNPDFEQMHMPPRPHGRNERFQPPVNYFSGQTRETN